MSDSEWPLLGSVREMMAAAGVVEETAAMESPETRYARSGEINIAYQVVGEGDCDVVYVPGGVSNVALIWDTPREAPLLRELSRFARVIVFDKRGTGMSDRVAGAPDLETRMDDLRAVMDSARSRRAAIFAIGQGVPMSILFAATYPERTAALVLLSGFARSLWGPEYPLGSTEQDYHAGVQADLQFWFGTREQAAADLLSRGSGTVDEVRRVIDYYRQSASPGAVEALAEMDKQIDVEKVLPAIHVPTLVVHGTADTYVRLDVGRHLAKRIPSARLLELPGAGRYPRGQAAATLMNAVYEFLRRTEKDDVPLETSAVTPSSSPISSAPPRWLPSWAIGDGANCVSVTMRWCGPSLLTFGAAKSTPPETVSWPPLTGRRGRSAAHVQPRKP